MSSKGQKTLKFKPRLRYLKQLPTFVFMKEKELPASSKVISHQHSWDQLIYAIQGVLEVKTEVGSYIIPPQQAVWIPENHQHSIASLKGAQLRSVHIETGMINNFGHNIRVLKVDQLVKALIKRASTYQFTSNITAEQQRLLSVLVDQIAELSEVDLCLPFSADRLLLPILNWQQQHPASSKNLQDWSVELATSSKTLSRRFKSELGMNFSQWRQQLKLHKAIQWLNDGQSVTQVALNLGFESLPAFIQMFKRHLGVTPGKFSSQ